jgi:hypothetical protein
VETGIVRDLPNGALAASPGSIDIEVESVTDEVGRPMPFQVEEFPAFDRLRVGDPASRISGQTTVHIDYLVTGGLTVDGESATID